MEYVVHIQSVKITSALHGSFGCSAGAGGVSNRFLQDKEQRTSHDGVRLLTIIVAKVTTLTPICGHVSFI